MAKERYIPAHARSGRRKPTPVPPALKPEATAVRPPEPAARPQEPTLGQELTSLFIKIALLAGAAVLVFTFMYGFYRNLDPAMNPALKDGDLVMFYRMDKQYALSDLLLLDFQGKRQIRRVVATAGDVVDITEDGLTVNGALQQEPGIFEETARYVEGVPLPLTLGEGEVFVLGDARENAADSRVYGAVNTEDTLGKVIAIMRRRYF